MLRFISFLSNVPSPGHVDINFTTINWWYFTIVLFVTFVVMGLRASRVYLRSAAVLVGVAVGYALFMVYLLPYFSR